MDQSIVSAFTANDGTADEELLMDAIHFISYHLRNEMISLQQAGLKERYAFPISEYARWHDNDKVAGYESKYGDNQDCKGVDWFVG